MFPVTPIPGQLAIEVTDRLIKLLTLHYAYPLPYPIAGGFVEALFADAVGGRRERRKLLFDVLRGEIGWSLKTINVHTPSMGRRFEVVLQRCNIFKDTTINLASPEAALGARILSRFNEFCQRSAATQSVSDPRTAFLMWNNLEHDFVLFQQRYRQYTSAELTWKWATPDRNSLIASSGDKPIFRWYRSGTQLFGSYVIPPDARFFHIDWTRADLDEVFAFLVTRGIAGATIKQ